MVYISRKAIKFLFKDFKRKLIKLISTNKTIILFQLKIKQTFTLHFKEQQRNSDFGNSLQLDLIIITISISTLPNTGFNNFAQIEHLVKMAAFEKPLIYKTPIAKQIEIISNNNFE